MKPIFKLKLPADTFTFKPIIPKPKKETSKSVKLILYCVAKKNENNEWVAHINTKGLENYEDVTILSFTEKSFELKGRTDVFRVHKDEHGHWVRVIRTESDANFYPGNREGLCTLCENCIFSGYIVKEDGIKKFDMSIYQGTYKQCEELLTKINKMKK